MEHILDRYDNLIARYTQEDDLDFVLHGFIREGVLRECILYNGSYESLMIMSMLENEYIDS